VRTPSSLSDPVVPDREAGRPPDPPRRARAAHEALQEIEQSFAVLTRASDTIDSLAAGRVLGHMAQVDAHGASVVAAVKQTSETLATVDDATHRIEQTVVEQRDSTRQSEATMSGALERIAGAVEDSDLVASRA
jgi:hypothetical protein